MSDMADYINQEYGGDVWEPDPPAMQCAEPGCGGMLTLKESKYGQFYGCDKWATTGCSGSVGAHPDATPIGIPADKETKALRIEAHQLFDHLWQGGAISRKEVYLWLSDAMGMTTDEAHIGNFNAEQCRKLIRLRKGRNT